MRGSPAFERLGAGFHFPAIAFGFVEVAAGQRHVDRTAQQSHPAGPVLPRQYDPQLGPRRLAVTHLAAHQRLTRLRFDTEGTRMCERHQCTVGVAAQPAHLTQLVVALAGRAAVDLFQCATGGREPVLEKAVIVGCGHQLKPVHVAHPAVVRRRGEVVAPALHRLRPRAHPRHIGEPVALGEHDAVDAASPVDRNLVGQHRQHRLVDQAVRLGHAGLADGFECLGHMTQGGQRGAVQPGAHIAQRLHAKQKRLRVTAEQRREGIEIGEVAVRRPLGRTFEKPTGAVHPAVRDVEVATGEPGQRRGRRPSSPPTLDRYEPTARRRVRPRAATPCRGRSAKPRRPSRRGRRCSAMCPQPAWANAS